MPAKTLQLRMMTIANSFAAQDRACEQGFAPQSYKSLRIKIPRVNGPQPHQGVRWDLTLEVSGRCHRECQITAAHRSGPLDRIVR